jgi:hypothetical protein
VALKSALRFRDSARGGAGWLVDGYDDDVYAAVCLAAFGGVVAGCRVVFGATRK